MGYGYKEFLKSGVIQTRIKDEIDEVYRKARLYDKEKPKIESYNKTKAYIEDSLEMLPSKTKDKLVSKDKENIGGVFPDKGVKVKIGSEE